MNLVFAPLVWNRSCVFKGDYLSSNDKQLE